ncbi:LacI family DNA-binding transcriptional regulator [Microlunatus soli]|uniref:DNA-binding transcriptional regulator, LacI/PurR family n=1 Tax=Microlunatus soli TaxID=630515 RepID=A0A1H1ZRR1_9ACTN|nr:LacI family DNA-binding transcriptional regulator [Microlunatus soli]SDT36511.1 DNA-binding transcriptional regulator, LacI/PurR family [Microlunatus soli]
MTAPRPRLADVAERAGVSMKTVSNVINDYPHISAATRSRVETAIDALGYRPNLSARNLARGRAGMIALVVPQLDMPYFASLARHVIDAAHGAGSVVLIEQTGGDLQAERQLVAGEFARRVDGIILNPLAVGAEEIARRTDQTPLVLLGERTLDGVAPHVGIDNHAAAAIAAEHLIERGCTRLGMIGASPPLRQNVRYLGFRQAVRAAGLDLDQHLLRPTAGVRGIDGERAVEEMIDTGKPLPDGLFCATDWLALGAIRALHRHRIAVPQDVAVIGFDDIPYGEASTPSLSTIATDREQIARRAVALLNAPDKAAAEEVTIDFELIVRESTAR